MARSFRFYELPAVMNAFAVACCIAVLLALASAPARAGGTVRIQHNDGSVDKYDDVGIKIIHNALYLTSADGKGTLVVNRAACSSNGQLLTCLPTSVTLIQGGSAKPLDLATGTIYANMTDEKQPLPLSSTQVPPHSLVFSISTKIGTYVNLSGTIDKVTK